jgi:hypothetical protein
MELMNQIFRLGVVFAIFGFIWGIFELGLNLLSGGRTRTISEIYFIKAIKYLFLVDVTFLFCLDDAQNLISTFNIVIAGLVLLTYFVGKLQNQQNKMAMFQMMGAGITPKQTTFNMRVEIGVIVLAIGVFSLFIFYPDIAKNPISIWFHESIINIEDTPVFGFIFKVIGFFFLVSMIFKMLNGFNYLISGKPFVQASSSFQSFTKNKKDDEFDDYEELDN